MAQDTDELRARIEEQRMEITGTVEQIENRIMPSRIMARRRDHMRRTLTDWKDAVFGNDEPEYQDAWAMYGTGSAAGRYFAHSSGQSSGQHDQGLVGRAGEATSHAFESAKENVAQAPQMLRRQTRGNPMAAGVVALGAGWLFGTVLPRTQEERALAQRMEPKLAETAAVVRSEGQALADEMKEPAREAVEQVKHTGQEVASELRDEAKDAASSVRSTATQ
jgi:hypothetical protein